MCKAIFTVFGSFQFFPIPRGNFPMPFVTQVLGTYPWPVRSASYLVIIFFTLECNLLLVLCADFLAVSFPSPSMEVITEEQFLSLGGENYDYCVPLQLTSYKLVIMKLQKWIPNMASLSTLSFLHCSTQLPRFSSRRWSANSGNNVACWEDQGSKPLCLSLHMANWRPAMHYHRELLLHLLSLRGSSQLCNKPSDSC